MRIFISGGAGVIGTALVEKLLKLDHEVFVGDLKPCPANWRGRLRYRQGDLNAITRQELLEFDPDLFFHLAATFERSVETFPFFKENFHHNILLSHHLIDCLKESPSLKKVVFASSYLIYDPKLYQNSSYEETVAPLNEQSNIYPRNLCGVAKLLHEIELGFLGCFLSDSKKMISARIFRVFGRHSRDIISRWVRASLRNEPLKVYRPEGRFDYIFADDVAEGLYRLSQCDYSGIVNLGSGQNRSVQDVINIISQHFTNLQIEYNESDIPFENSLADITLLHHLTNWKPPHTLEDGILELIAYETNQLHKPQHLSSNQNVLITSISRKVPLIEAVRKATKKLGSFEKVYGSDSDPECLGKYFVDTFWRCPRLNAMKIDELIEYCHLHSISAIIPTRDADLAFFSQHKTRLESVGIHVMVSSAESINTCLDKLTFSKFLHARQFPTIPTSESLFDINSDCLVVKERFGAGSSQIGINLTQEEAKNHALKVINPIFQPYIEGEEWSIDLYRTHQGDVKGSVSRKRDVVINGESQVTTTALFPEIQNLCCQMANALSLYGHVIFQVIVDAKRNFHVIECNPRFGGASTASLAVGLDSFYWFLQESMGYSLENEFFFRNSNNLRQIRIPTDRMIPWSSSSI